MTYAEIILLTSPQPSCQKDLQGEIALSLVRIEESQKCAKGIHLADLARYLEFRREAARKEMEGLTK